MAQAWGKEKDYGSIEKGKVADVIIVRGDPTKSISDTQHVEMVFIDGKKMDTSFHADYKNPMPRPIEDRPESEAMLSEFDEDFNFREHAQEVLRSHCSDTKNTPGVILSLSEESRILSPLRRRDPSALPQDDIVGQTRS